jgi:peptide/nickel transport system ATP-binding protein
LCVEGLRAEFRIRAEWYQAVDGVSFPLDRNETRALVGESGSGKSVTAFAIMGLVPQPKGHVSAGCIFLDGVELRTLDEAGFEALCGDRMTTVFQKPLTSLNPVMSIEAQIAEALRIHRHLSRADSEAKALATLAAINGPP